MRLLSLVAITVAFSAVGSAQTPVKSVVSFLAVTQSDSPVRVLGVERPTGASSPMVTVENASPKPVKAVRVALAIVAPRGCSPEKHPAVIVVSNSGPDSLDYSNGEIAPQQRAVLRGVDIVGSAFGAAAQLKSRYLQVQLGVVAVQFADGTSWRWRDQPEQRTPDVFSPEQLEADSGECSQWPWIPNALDNVQGKVTIGWAGAGQNGLHVDSESERHPKPDPASRVLPTRYSVSCETKETGAYCELP
jgi:hypothetical protein